MMKDEQTGSALPATTAVHPSSTLVIGLGNPILSDDGVGWKIVEQVQSKFENRRSKIEFDCLSLGGLSLMERMIGYRRVILVDSMETSQSDALSGQSKYPVGSVRVIKLEELENPSAGHSASAHDTSLITALDTAKAMGLPIPELVEIVAIEARHVYDFSEELSPSVAEAVPAAVQAVMDLLSKEEP
jgi:hydrogenase maturation protease